jgi:hypothetical protein
LFATFPNQTAYCTIVVQLGAAKSFTSNTYKTASKQTVLTSLEAMLTENRGGYSSNAATQGHPVAPAPRTHSNTRNSNAVMDLLHGSLDTWGEGVLLT